MAGRLFPHAVLARTVVLALLAIGAAVWGLVRHYTVQPPPLRVPIPPAAEGVRGELPAPELLGNGDGGG